MTKETDEKLDVMGLAEIAETYGVRRQTAHQWTNNKKFPDPAARLRMGPIWFTEQVDRWAHTTGRKKAPKA